MTRKRIKNDGMPLGDELEKLVLIIFLSQTYKKVFSL